MAATEMTDAEIFTLAPQLREIAEEAGRTIMRIYHGGFDVEEKPDSTLVTDADHASERLILAALAELTPDIPIISEERDARGDSPDAAGGLFWAVDPLDGTREFVARYPGFSVNIGLVRGQKPIFGVLHGPVTGTTYWTERADHAMRADAGARGETIKARSAPKDGPTLITSRSHGKGRRLTAYLSEITVMRHIQEGSALKFGRIAEGAADIYPRFGPTSEWDTAAGHAILNAAGGSVRTLDGKELTYGKYDYLNPDFIARGIG